MSLPATHIVQKSHLQIKVRDKARAYEIQSQVIALFQTAVVPMLEQEFDALAPADQLIRIDRLQLDLGTIDLQDLHMDFPRMVTEKLRAAFAEAMAKDSTQQNSIIMTQESVASSDLANFIAFLETGQQQWNSASHKNLPVALLETLLEGYSEPLKAALVPRLSNPAVVRRIGLQFPLPLQVQLLALLSDVQAAEIARLVSFLQAATETISATISWLPNQKDHRFALVQGYLLGQLPQLQRYSQKHQATLLAMISDWIQSGKCSAIELKSQLGQLSLQELLILRPLFSAENAESTAYPTPLMEKGSLPLELESFLRSEIRELLFQSMRLGTVAKSEVNFEKNIQREVEALPEQQQRWVFQILGVEAPNKRVNSKKSTESEKLHFRKDSKNIDKEAFDVKTKEDEHPPKFHQETPEKKAAKLANSDIPRAWQEDSTLFIDNAGLVLLNPFLNYCFESLGWMKDGSFESEILQENAVMLTAFLAYGETEVSEARLPLPKLLCGMEIDRPVRAHMELSEAAKAEAESLLTAANEHWKKAGKLSPDQFREAFLVREGKLAFTGLGWNLKVDRHTIDILLEFLPWSFGMIKLPWMQGLLTVDW